jgi:hypothetical protein
MPAPLLLLLLLPRRMAGGHVGRMAWLITQ